MNSLTLQRAQPAQPWLVVGTIIAMRSLLGGLAVSALDFFFDFGAGLFPLWLAVMLGVASASWLAFRPINHRGFFVLSVIVTLCYLIGWRILLELPFGSDQEPFSLLLLRDTTHVLGLIFGVSAVATWGFWRVRGVLTLEFIILGAIGIALMVGHRELRIEQPRILSEIAWRLDVAPLVMIIVVGVILALLLLGYLWCATIPGKRFPVGVEREFDHFLTPQLGIGLGVVILTLGALWLVALAALSHFTVLIKALPPEGVGLSEKEQQGLSPLNFSGAGTGNNQPSALVRLEGDYVRNPFTPMLYLREAALAQFNGRELVSAGPAHDLDVNTTGPHEPFDQSFFNTDEFSTGGLSQPAERLRTPLTHSVYLMAQHNLAFAIDFPLSIRPLKNPNPGRFKGAYRATSLVPSFDRERLLDAEVGNPDWNEETRALYLALHPDLRYAAMANSVTQGAASPIAKAFLVADYLSQRSIYTLTPNHNVAANADPVAPYLFGDMRGYCVHFAHASVFMLRALGIPSRIGTGYMTDLSQSKDGHILLRLSDRHAWAEVYVRDVGWIPFDTMPNQVENHADTPVDMGLLEELMGMIDPGEELLGEHLLKDEANIFEPSPFSMPSGQVALLPLGVLACLYLLGKVLLYHGYLLTSTPISRLERSYLAVAARLADLKITRRTAETREEFKERASEMLGGPTLSLTELLNRVRYWDPSVGSLSQEVIDELRRRDLATLRVLPLWQRALVVMSPRSIGRFLGGRGW